MVRNTLNVPRSLFVGFDTLFEDLERIHASARSGNDNYPPHNVVKIDEEKFLIELAIAGFKKSDIDIELKDGILKIKGEVEPTDVSMHIKAFHLANLRRASASQNLS